MAYLRIKGCWTSLAKRMRASSTSMCSHWLRSFLPYKMRGNHQRKYFTWLVLIIPIDGIDKLDKSLFILNQSVSIFEEKKLLIVGKHFGSRWRSNKMGKHLLLFITRFDIRIGMLDGRTLQGCVFVGNEILIKVEIIIDDVHRRSPLREGIVRNRTQWSRIGHGRRRGQLRSHAWRTIDIALLWRIEWVISCFLARERAHPLEEVAYNSSTLT